MRDPKTTHASNAKVTAWILRSSRSCPWRRHRRGGREQDQGNGVVVAVAVDAASRHAAARAERHGTVVFLATGAAELAPRQRRRLIGTVGHEEQRNVVIVGLGGGADGRAVQVPAVDP